MNRQHKYQYWYSGKMREVGSIEFFENGTYRVNDEFIGGVLREWTGLKDKNGKEIYEGDIVKASWENERDPIAFAIEWDKGGGYFAPEEIGCDYMPSLGHDELDIEVIGNIYENSELIKN